VLSIQTCWLQHGMQNNDFTYKQTNISVGLITGITHIFQIDAAVLVSTDYREQAKMNC